MSDIPDTVDKLSPTFVVAHSTLDATSVPTVFRSYTGENVRPSINVQFGNLHVLPVLPLPFSKTLTSATRLYHTLTADWVTTILVVSQPGIHFIRSGIDDIRERCSSILLLETFSISTVLGRPVPMLMRPKCLLFGHSSFASFNAISEGLSHVGP